MTNVAKYKRRASENAAAYSGRARRPSRSSSVNEELDDKDFTRLVGGYETALANLPIRIKRPRGMVTVIEP